MKPDEAMVYTGMALVPITVTVISAFLLRAVQRRSVSWLSSFFIFCAGTVFGMIVSFLYVWSHSDLLHGDGALAIVAAPITGAILTAPIAVFFAIALVAIARGARGDDNA